MNLLQIAALCARIEAIPNSVKRDNLTFRQLAVLIEVARAPRCVSTGDLWRALQYPNKGSIVRACDALIAAGLLLRRRHAKDTRLVDLSVTTDGFAFLASLSDAQPMERAA